MESFPNRSGFPIDGPWRLPDLFHPRVRVTGVNASETMRLQRIFGRTEAVQACLICIGQGRLLKCEFGIADIRSVLFEGRGPFWFSTRTQPLHDSLFHVPGRCRECTKVFWTSLELVRHITFSMCTEDLSFRVECPLCGRTCSRDM